jgi:hypothetical protein
MKQHHYAKEAYQCCDCGTRVHADLKRWPRCRLGCGGHQDVDERQVNVLCLPLQAAVHRRNHVSLALPPRVELERVVVCPSSASVLVRCPQGWHLRLVRPRVAPWRGGAIGGALCAEGAAPSIDDGVVDGSSSGDLGMLTCNAGSGFQSHGLRRAWGVVRWQNIES